ncbi:hypothetical protein Hanom_Chr10g00889681 [Helianthus anomalus]
MSCLSVLRSLLLRSKGVFPHGEIKFQESRSYEQTYQAYFEETASHVSTTHRIVRECDEKRLSQLKAKLEADQAKFEADRKTKEWSVAGWKRKAKAEVALLSEERKNWKKICAKDNAEKVNLRNVINNFNAEIEKLKKQDA